MTEHSFAPGPDTARDFRDALGCFGTGVTVVTAQSPQGPLGMTANSFASLSLEPPLVLWAPAKTSRRFDSFAKARHFAIHVMAEDQHDLARHFARRGDGFDAFDWTSSDRDVPILAGCLARFECHLSAVHDAGDHAIIVGHVDHAAYRPGQGLIFKRGQYGGFSGLD
ncbi:flavin reductase family protein [Aestuariivita sp.]|jgi:flavin reductase (DIM6/NTAB) family NADH-FMN oxidoreductase RutF|uniref:flavin reductase family protein n=1 Tax=Aestuariivita sp. TaxID=1872407 RepID=UPI0021707F71|nr:flavin reductase family protein [Aestuariivita sp.]MCE8009479.1 flavin reductase family protein [Aestuariivita sp.]